MVDRSLRLLAAFALLASVPAASAGAARASDASRLAALARDVDRVESVRAVKRLQTAWALYVDEGQWDRAAALFTADAELVHGELKVRGRPAILGYHRSAIGKGVDGLPPRTLHTPLVTAPIITLSADGNSGRGRWHAVSLRGAFGGDASWAGGIFECDYVRERGQWKISRQHFTPMMAGPYATGWRAASAEVPLVPYHFAPEQVGASAAFGPAVRAAAPAHTSLAALSGRVRALQDEAAVRNLQNAFGYYLDFKMWDDVVDLFSRDGSVTVVGTGDWHGAHGVRRWLEASGPQGLRYGEMNDHLQLDLVVEIAADGVHARGRGIELAMLGANAGPAYWALARFDNRYVKQGGTWRIQAVRIAPWMRTDYAHGWAKDWPAGAAVPPPPGWAFERSAPVARPAAGTIVAAEAGVQAAAGYDAVENLAGGYGQYLDDNHWDELGSLFSADGERDSAGGGFIRTPARIASFSRQRYGPFNPKRASANMHIRAQPVIHIAPDGRHAQDRTRLFQFAIPPADPAARGTAMFISGMYEDDLVIEDGRWKIRRADIDHLVYMPYKTGWTGIAEGAGARMSPPLGAVAGQKFDAFNTGDIDAAYPRVPHMWFHYRNPVSGRAPRYLMPKYILPAP